MSPRRNLDSLTPSLASECAPPPEPGGRHTCLRARGWGSPNSDDWSLALCLYSVGDRLGLLLFYIIAECSLFSHYDDEEK